ncbi:MAG: hypothetical protein ACI4KG_07255 [Oscillospiraceae bacterium]
MEKFRKQIKTRMIGYIITAILLAILYIVLVFIDKTNAWGTVLLASISGTAEEGDFTSGFRTGFCSSIVGFAVVKAIFCAAALKNEKKLKAMYIKETDERTAMILQKTASSSFCVTIMALAVASVVASFFSMTVLYTLIAIIFFIVFVRTAFQFYYTRKY